MQCTGIAKSATLVTKQLTANTNDPNPSQPVEARTPNMEVSVATPVRASNRKLATTTSDLERSCDITDSYPDDRNSKLEGKNANWCPFGTINIYGTTSEPFDADARDIARSFASYGAVALKRQWRAMSVARES